jgi:hypothetical protein
MIRASAYRADGYHRGKFWERQLRLTGILFHV